MPSRREEHRASAQQQVDRWETAMSDLLLGLFERQEAVVLARLTGTKARKGTRHWSPAPARFEMKSLDWRYIVDPSRWALEAINAVRDLFTRLFAEVIARLTSLFGLPDGDGDGEPDFPDPAATAVPDPVTVVPAAAAVVPAVPQAPDPGEVARQVQRRLDTVAQGVQTAVEQVQQVIADADAAGEPMDRIAEQVRGTYAERRAGWVHRIVTTNVVGAMNEASLVAAQAAGCGHKQWLASHDARVRDTHVKADGQVVAVGEPFELGGFADHPAAQLMYPGDPDGPAAEVINCRCTLLFPLPRLGEPAYDPATSIKRYNPGEVRDERGRWTASGVGGPGAGRAAADIGGRGGPRGPAGLDPRSGPDPGPGLHDDADDAAPFTGRLLDRAPVTRAAPPREHPWMPGSPSLSAAYGRYRDPVAGPALNEALRAGRPLTGEQQATVDGLLDFPSRTTAPLLVYRGMQSERPLTAGTVITDRSFTSTTLSVDVADRFVRDDFGTGRGGKGYLLAVHLPTGARAINTLSYDALEVILPPGSTLRVTHVDADGMVHADLTDAEHKAFNPGEVRDRLGRWTAGAGQLGGGLDLQAAWHSGQVDPGVRAGLAAHLDYDDPATGLSARVTSVGADSDTVEAVSEIRDRAGARVGWARRTLHPDGHVHHDHFELDPAVQGAGFATRWNAHAEDGYRAMGFDRVTLKANIDVGGYAWARSGYDWDLADNVPDESTARSIVQEYVLDLIEPHVAGDPAARQQLDAAWAAVDGPPEQWPTPFDLSQIGWRPGAVTWPGKQGMLGSSWQGVKRL